MTQNLIAYANFIESARHNRQSESLGFGNLAELSRHNIASEGIGYYEAATHRSAMVEQSRHNVASEANQLYGMQANYDIGLQNAEVSRLTAATREREATYNFINGSSQADSAERNATTNAANASTNREQARIAEKRVDIEGALCVWRH